MNAVEESLAGLPIDINERCHIHSKRLCPFETVEVEIRCGEDSCFDSGSVSALLRLGKRGEETVPSLWCDLADILNGSAGTVRTLKYLMSKGIFVAFEICVVDLPLTDFIGVGWCDPASCGATCLLSQYVGAVVLPSEIEQSV